jgi:hypothetical protein
VQALSCLQHLSKLDVIENLLSWAVTFKL